MMSRTKPSFIPRQANRGSGSLIIRDRRQVYWESTTESAQEQAGSESGKVSTGTISIWDTRNDLTMSHTKSMVWMLVLISGRSTSGEKQENTEHHPAAQTGADWGMLEVQQVWRRCAGEMERGGQHTGADQQPVTDKGNLSIYQVKNVSNNIHVLCLFHFKELTIGKSISPIPVWDALYNLKKKKSPK